MAWVVALPRVRGLIGGRFNFTARSVIAPDHTLQIDEVKLISVEQHAPWDADRQRIHFTTLQHEL